MADHTFGMHRRRERSRNVVDRGWAANYRVVGLAEAGVRALKEHNTE